ncbi:MAG: YraN family protein [Clostridia bacterium]|nr:YraN family protein [Clostridia bacterium]
MKENRRKLGEIGERAVAQFLKRKGYKVIENNYRTRYGEIDIIALKDGILSFVEVKTRTTLQCGTPEEAVDCRKQKKIRSMAVEFLTNSKIRYKALRFDVAAVKASKDGTIENIKIYEGAF